MKQRELNLAGRRSAAVAGIALVALLVGAEAWLAFQRPLAAGSACWILPNGYAFLIPGAECPLGPNDRVMGFEPAAQQSDPSQSRKGWNEREQGHVTLRVLRDGVEERVAVPLGEEDRSRAVTKVLAGGVTAGALMAIPVLLLVRSTSRSVVPLAWFYSIVGAIVVVILGGRGNAWLSRLALLGMTLAPAILGHLSLIFPRERRVVREVPELVRVPYVLSGLLVVMGALALERSPLLWPTFMVLLLALTIGCWMVLTLSCVFALRESRSSVERARAKLLCFGALVLPIGPTLVLAGFETGFSHVATAYLWSFAAVIPLPIGLAVSRYNLFNLEWDVRRWTGRLVYLGAAALVVAIVLQGAFLLMETPEAAPDPGLTLLVAFACVAAIEPLRGRMLGFLEARLLPRLEELRRFRESFERSVRGTLDEDSVAQRLGTVLSEALDPTAVWVFLEGPGGWRLAFAGGASAAEGAYRVPEAVAALKRQGVRQLVAAPEDEPTAEEQMLAESGIEVVASLDAGQERLGVVLLAAGRPGSPYSGLDLDFVAMTCAQAGMALRTARLTEERLAKERAAATGRVAVALAHDLGKELDWVGRLVTRLPMRLKDPDRLARDVAMLQEFTEGLVRGLRRFVEQATDTGSEAPGRRRFDELVDAAVGRVSRIHGSDRVSQSIDPALCNMRFTENFGRVLSNLLDNALHATPSGEPVRLYATLDGQDLRVVVEDRGCGIPTGDEDRVFEAGFSTRPGRGGLGIGLSVSREIVGSLGGRIRISSQPAGGARAEVRVPRPR